MNKLLKVLVALPGILFVVTGLRWLVDPASAAAQFGMPLLDGLGRSSQIGDMASFFLTLGVLILVALITARRVWYYPPIMLLVFTAIGRTLAWLIHGAAPAVEMIAPEIIIACLLLIASRRLAEPGKPVMRAQSELGVMQITLALAIVIGLSQPVQGLDLSGPAGTVQAAAEQPIAEPAALEPAAVEPAAMEPAAVEPAAVEPAALEPAAVEPAAVEPAAVEPAAVEPVSAESAAEKPALDELAAVEPAAAEPAEEGHAIVAPAAQEVAAPNPASVDAESAEPPNIVLILADDLGFSDIAPYGSEIRTPALSALAEQGVSFTNYHTAASCAPTRAMLLTGVDSHRAGVPNIPEMIPPEQRQHAHYQGVLGRNVVTVATLLQDSGYHTYMAGKWHLGMTQDLLPSRRGFERTVAMADSGADNWEQKPYIPIYEKANWFADGEEFQLPDDFYSSRFLVDKIIEFIDSHGDDGQPFFAYLPMQAVHIPVQAPQEFIDRYMGVYDSGWETLREQRHARAVELGIVPPGTGMVRMSTTRDWDDLSTAQKRYQAKRMAVYAAMVEAMDFHVGRLVEHLKRTGRYDNTIFIFTSDNGPEASGLPEQDTALNRFAMRRQDYSVDYDTLGLKGSFNAISPSFTSSAAAPLAYYKFYSGEGGMRVPLIIAGQQLPRKQVLSNAFTYVTDLAPTILDLTGVSVPAQRYGGRPIEPMIGRNLLPLLRGSVDRVYSEQDAVGYELAGNAALFQGDYKIVLNRGPVGDNQWHLYNIVTDPGETDDLSATMPQRLQDMLWLYRQYAIDNAVLPVPEGYNDRLQVVFNGLHDRYGRNILLAVLSFVVLLPFYIVYRSKSKG